MGKIVVYQGGYGARLKYWMAEMGISTNELITITGIKKNTINNIIREASHPSYETLCLLFYHTNINPFFLFFGELPVTILK